LRAVAVSASYTGEGNADIQGVEAPVGGRSGDGAVDNRADGHSAAKVVADYHEFTVLVHARLPRPDRHAESGETRADDRHVHAGCQVSAAFRKASRPS